MNIVYELTQLVSKVEHTIQNHISFTVTQLRPFAEEVESYFIWAVEHLTVLYQKALTPLVTLLIEKIWKSYQLIQHYFFEITSLLITIETILVLVAAIYLLLQFTRREKRQVVERSLYLLGSKTKALFSQKGKQDLLDAFEKQLALQLYNFLTFLWSYLELIPFFNNPFLLRNRLIQKLRSLFKKHRMLSKLQKFNLITNFQQKESEQAPLSILEKNQAHENYTSIPKELVLEFSQHSIDEDILDFPQWREIADRLLVRHNEKLPTVQLITGMSGIGKTTLIRYLYEKLKQYDRQLIQCSRHESLLDNQHIKNLSESLQKYSSERPVIFVDDIELTFLKKVGGYADFQTMLQLITKTRHKVTWVISMNSFFLAYMQTVLQVSEIFQFQYNFADIDEDKIRSIIENKVKRHGFETKVLADATQQATVKKLVSSKFLAKNNVSSYLISDYTRKNIEAGSCNLYFHFYYYLHSIKTVYKGQIYIGAPELINISFLSRYDISTYFILEAIIVHKSVSLQNLCQMFTLPNDKIELAVSMLVANNVLEKTLNGLSIFAPLYYPVVRFLQNKYILE